MGHDGVGRRFVPVRQAKNRRRCQKAGERRSEAARAQTRKCAQKDKPKHESEERLRRMDRMRNYGPRLLHDCSLRTSPRKPSPKRTWSAIGLGKIVATHGVARDRPDLRNGGDTRRALRSDGASRLQERDQECQRKDFVTGLRDVIELKWKLWLP